MLSLLLCSCERIETGIVFQKSYIPEKRWTTSEPVYRTWDDKSGHHRQLMYYRTEHHYSPEKFCLTIRGDDSKGKVQIRDVYVPKEVYLQTNPGDFYDKGSVKPFQVALEN